MREKKIWNFKYRGFDCEVVHWNYDKPWDGFPSGNWNGYIVVKKKQLPDRFAELLCKKKKTTYASMPWRWDSYKVESIFEMKCGVTFYQVICDEFTGEKAAIKVGNDYQHLWNENHHYNEEDIVRDLKQSVDKFIERYPEYLVWNPHDGSYIKPTESDKEEREQ